ncbi:MAG TPA: hypothetical protein VKP08_04065, partial [Anaerolineales bacterium]|nr:hypothetical protein [Anaerolineales bacterium]
MNVRGKSKQTEAREAKLALRTLFTFFSMITILSLAACTPPLPITSTEIIPTLTSELNTTATAVIPVASQT